MQLPTARLYNSTRADGDIYLTFVNTCLFRTSPELGRLGNIPTAVNTAVHECPQMRPNTVFAWMTDTLRWQSMTTKAVIFKQCTAGI